MFLLYLQLQHYFIMVIHDKRSIFITIELVIYYTITTYNEIVFIAITDFI